MKNHIKSLLRFTFIEYWNTAAKNKAISPLESTFASVSKMAVDFHEDTNQEETQDGVIMVVMTHKGKASDLVTKYRPPHPVIVVSPNEQVLRQTNARFGQVAFKPSQFDDLDVAGKEARPRHPSSLLPRLPCLPFTPLSPSRVASSCAASPTRFLPPP